MTDPAKRTADAETTDGGAEAPDSVAAESVDADLVAAVKQALTAETRVEFDRRVAAQAPRLTHDCQSGRINTGFHAIGIEVEGYVVDDDGRPIRVPDQVFEDAGCGKELGVHNIELHTDPDSLTQDGFERQTAALRERFERTREALTPHDARLILDAMWTIPPTEGTAAYLGAIDEHDGVTVSRNMRADARYHALDNETLRRAGGEIQLDIPGVDDTFPSILVESLATSMQPHLQVPSTETFPDYFNTAIRTLGPVLALATNSPFMPADLYTVDDGDERALVEETPHELRVLIFEGSMNAASSPGAGKVRVPPDIHTLEEVVTRLVADETFAPKLDVPDPDEEYPDPYPELTHKRGTYWRWVRAVIGGQVPQGADGDDLRASVRIEYRPLPTQPTIADTMALDALVVGLLCGLVESDHPLTTLSWEDAEASFYSAVDEGLDAELAWITADGDHTTDTETIYEEVFTYARRGLRAAGFEAQAVAHYLDPVETRWTERRTPSRWKKAAVRERLDEGASLRRAIEEMQREYLRRAGDDPFVEWPWPGDR